MLCLADWVLIEDFGFFGGLGTDPNSMIPFALLATAGYLALARAPAPATAAAPAAADTAGAQPGSRWQRLRHWPALGRGVGEHGIGRRRSAPSG